MQPLIKSIAKYGDPEQIFSLALHKLSPQVQGFLSSVDHNTRGRSMRHDGKNSTEGLALANGARAEAYRIASRIERDFQDARGAGTNAAVRQSAASRHLAQLRQRLRRERALGRGGYDGYDLSRHLALAQMVKDAARAARGAAPAPGRAASSAPQQNAPAA
ncbi:hypothetical protein RDV64_18495 [Acuticoccus sp. MNP-M23]|uniref:hypothetical protein n=1 Tax=Acuticoccus sp. MNP-M23 TaxID=3072793 RepID=UPI0028157025|nr:hypothetical protein [Acuticoccus sp. MNP-M23]WMS42038.1 hypothetical protein RDV64_18495 [Acuticoccus sp. MNP-M23]